MARQIAQVRIHDAMRRCSKCPKLLQGFLESLAEVEAPLYEAGLSRKSFKTAEDCVRVTEQVLAVMSNTQALQGE